MFSSTAWSTPVEIFFVVAILGYVWIDGMRWDEME